MRQSRFDPLALLHVVVGAAMTLLVVVSRPPEGDPTVFGTIAGESARGLVAYRDYPVEYPPLALVQIDLPRLLGGPSPEAYVLIFTLISVLVTLATGAAVYWLARRRWSTESPANAMLLFTGLVFAGAPLVFWRFDILAALLTTLALVAYAARQPTWSGLALGFGALTKLYPGALVPLLVVAQLFERNMRRAALIVVGAAIAVGAVMAQVFLVAGTGAFSFLTYQQQRGVEIESVSGGIALLMSVLGQANTAISFGFGSWQVSSPIIDSLAIPQLVLNAVLLAGLLAGMWISFSRDARNGGRIMPATLLRCSLAGLIVVMLINKVLSPQYLVWLVPFAALLPSRQSVLLLVIVVLTVLLYPLGFGSLLRIEPAAVLALNVRNLLLVVYFAWVCWPQRAPAPEQPAQRSERGYVRQPAQ
ncbi:MAG TPA: glycosyltransferase family 87 protein [Candidatus Limnocylindrales bacterium]